MRYAVIIEPDAMDHLRLLLVRDRATVLDAIDQHLVLTPMDETRNRKELRPNPLARWELRVGPFRVFYDVVENDQSVHVTAVGIKEHGRLLIGGREFRL